MASQHSGFDLTETEIIREVDGAFEGGSAVSSTTVSTQHTKAFKAPAANDWWKFDIWGNIIGTTSTKSIWINFDTDTYEIQFISTDQGSFRTVAYFITDGAGNSNWYGVSDGGVITRLYDDGTSASFPTTAGNITVQLSVANAADSIAIEGMIINSGGSA